MLGYLDGDSDGCERGVSGGFGGRITARTSKQAAVSCFDIVWSGEAGEGMAGGVEEVIVTMRMGRE